MVCGRIKNMRVNYRKAKLDDLDALCSLSTRRKFVRKQLKSRKNFIYLAEHKTKIIGFARGKVEDNPPIFQVKKAGVINDLFVEKEYRGKGIRAELTSVLLKEFSKRNLKFIKLTVDVRNLAAIERYRKFGFKDFQLKMVKNL